MKNPLRKRLLRELKNDIGKYLVIFLFMTATIGFVSGFLVADESMLYAYDESFEKYNVENGNFTTEQKLTDNQRTRLEKEKVTIYENFYKDEDADTDLDSEPESTIRLFKTRTEFNLVCLMKGEMPQQKDEIAIDRMYADNNGLQVGDVISVDKKELTVTGLVALSDYSALFSNSSDMMFDAVKFGVGIMTEEGYDAITDDHIKYCYSWKYDTEPKDENEEFANILLLFGMMMKPLLSHYQTEAVENMLADYQYILNVPDPIDEDDEYTLMGIVQKLLTPSLKTNTEGVETFAVTSLKNIPKNREGESISVYGIQKDSKYVSAELFENGVTISDGYAEKYGMKVGDTLELKEPYEDKTYSFEVKSIYAYPGALAVFLPMDVFCEEFDHPEDYFNGYFSNEPITDLEESYIATKITEDDMTKISRQLNVSMGEMFQLINVFSIVLFMLLIYLLTKLIIEKNTTSISMVKILGYENREILSLYLTATTWVVIVSIGVSLIIASALIRLIYVIMLSEYSGWLTYYIDPAIYGKMYLMGLAAYAVIAVLQFRHIQKIPMDEALKNVE